MTRTLATVALLAALALHLHGLLPYLGQSAQDFDALHVYLPLARQFLQQGLPFLLSEASLQAPPVAYLYPALLGADLATVKYANVALSCLLLLLVYRTAWLWHSRTAGAIAALLFAASPLAKPFLATALTEPPFLFLLGAWIWALAEWRESARGRFLLAAGVALGLAILTRASLFYALVLFVAYLAWRHRKEPVFAAHLLALALPLAFIAKNVTVFGFPFFATGAGNALYLGNSPWFGGYDPAYLGLVYDVGAITRSPSHLTPESDALLGAAGRALIASADAGRIAAMYAHKAVAFLFITNAENGGDVFAWRAWRIATLVLGVVGLAGLRDRWLRGVVASLLAYQVAVHVPALYNHRYSVGALDGWLPMLSGVGLAWLWQRRRPIEMGAVAATLAAAIVAGTFAARHGGMPEPDVLAGENILVWEREPGAARFDANAARLEIDIPESPGFSPWFNHVLMIDYTLARASRETPCGAATLAYRRAGEEAFSAPLVHAFRADAKRHVEQLGAEIPLHLGTAGRLRIDLRCASGSRFEIHRLAVYSARGALALRERLVSSAAPAPR